MSAQMTGHLINALFCLAGLSTGATIGWIIRVLICEANRRLHQHAQEPK